MKAEMEYIGCEELRKVIDREVNRVGLSKLKNKMERKEHWNSRRDKRHQRIHKVV